MQHMDTGNSGGSGRSVMRGTEAPPPPPSSSSAAQQVASSVCSLSGMKATHALVIHKGECPRMQKSRGNVRRKTSEGKYPEAANVSLPRCALCMLARHTAGR